MPGRENRIFQLSQKEFVVEGREKRGVKAISVSKTRSLPGS